MTTVTVALLGATNTGKTSFLNHLLSRLDVPLILDNGIRVKIAECRKDTKPAIPYDAYIVFQRRTVTTKLLLHSSYHADVEEDLLLLSPSHWNNQNVLYPICLLADKVVAAKRRYHMAAYKIQLYWRRHFYTPNRLGFSPYINSTYDALTK